MPRIAAVALAVSIVAAAAALQAPSKLDDLRAEGATGSHWAMFWNVANLFDTEDDPDVSGRDAMDPADLREKLKRLAAVVSRVDWGRGPDILGLAEVENEDLVRQVAGRGYRVVFEPGNDARGINVALATRLPAAGDPKHLDPETTGRTMLHAPLRIGGEVLHVFVVHLKSKWNVATKTLETRSDEQTRRKEARFLRGRIDKILAADRGANVLVMGDFNEDHRDSLFRDELLAVGYRRGGDAPSDRDDDHRLLNLGPALQQSFPGGGTAYYHPDWSILDNILVSEALALPGGLVATPFDTHIGVSVDLLNNYGTPDHFDPRYPTRVSDHLPVLIRIRTSPD